VEIFALFSQFFQKDSPLKQAQLKIASFLDKFLRFILRYLQIPREIFVRFKKLKRQVEFWKQCLIGPYNAGPKSELFLRVALIRAGINGVGVKRTVLKRKKNILDVIISAQNQPHLFEKMIAFH